MATTILGHDDRRLVADSALDLLVVEMVDLMHRLPTETENDKEAAYFKLENLGYRVGVAMVERWVTMMGRGYGGARSSGMWWEVTDGT